MLLASVFFSIPTDFWFLRQFAVKKLHGVGLIVIEIDCTYFLAWLGEGKGLETFWQKLSKVVWSIKKCEQTRLGLMQARNDFSTDQLFKDLSLRLCCFQMKERFGPDVCLKAMMMLMQESKSGKATFQPLISSFLMRSWLRILLRWYRLREWRCFARACLQPFIKLDVKTSCEISGSEATIDDATLAEAKELTRKILNPDEDKRWSKIWRQKPVAAVLAQHESWSHLQNYLKFRYFYNLSLNSLMSIKRLLNAFSKSAYCSFYFCHIEDVGVLTKLQIAYRWGSVLGKVSS